MTATVIDTTDGPKVVLDGGAVGAVFDLGQFLDTLPMTDDQRRLVEDGMARAAGLDAVAHPEYARHAALYLASLVLVGDVTSLDDEAWLTLELLRVRHALAAPPASAPQEDHG